MRWYAVQTYTGQESRVVQYVEDMLASGEMEGKISQVLMPTQEVVQVRNGKKTKTTRKFFPSYVLFEMELDRESSHFVRSVNGVSGFVGGKTPLPLRDEEIRRILGQTEQVTQETVNDIPYRIGDAVKIKEGPFKDFDGVVDEVHPEKGKIKVMVSVFGRSTPVEVDFVHVDQIS